MKYINTLTLLLASFVFTSCSSKVEQPTVTQLDTIRYSGQWHEVGRLPNRFEKDLVAAKATYTPRKIQGQPLTLLNEGLKKSGEKTSITGNVTQPDPKQPGRLEVKFDRFPANLFTGDYWVLGRTQDYRRALVGTPNQKMLWFLSKDKNDTKKNFTDMIKVAKDLGYSTEDIYWNPKRL